MATTDRPGQPLEPSLPAPAGGPVRDAHSPTAAGRAASGAAMVSGAASPAGDSAPDEEGWEEYDSAYRRFLLFTAMPSWMISLVVHMVALFLLAMITLPEYEVAPTELIVARPDPVPEQIEEFRLEQVVEVDEMELNPSSLGPTDAQTTQTIDVATPDVNFADDLEAAPIQIDLAEFAERTAPKNMLGQMLGVQSGTGVQGRGAAVRADMVKKYGGTAGSERAVAAALRWLAYHQLPDGGWSFDHTMGPGARLSPNPGDLREARNGATAMALLPFLGAGQTHVEGEYKEVVARGLYFLLGRQKTNGSFFEAGGSMYSHGLASIAVCEAYAMTNDPKLAGPAQAAINFIVFAQDPVGGGWRYEPRMGGDTSVVGWQVMALKSGHMGYLQVPPNVVAGATRFLDSVQTDGGAQYGYASPGAAPGTTSVGLLCRMHLGWKHEHPALTRGVEYLSNAGPSSENTYYNYYATQVMRHYGGELWEKWNAKMRDFLVTTQSTEGPAQGSWFLPGDHGSERGGRLYCTSMATMILEVYYRHMPIYGSKAAEEDFPL